MAECKPPYLNCTKTIFRFAFFANGGPLNMKNTKEGLIIKVLLKSKLCRDDFSLIFVVICGHYW
jgi:hypothetical protein